MNSSEFQSHTEQLEQLVQRASELSDDSARATALELLQSVMDLHGAVVSRILELLSESETGRSSMAKLGRDPLVCGLLVLYGLHPQTFEERVAEAIERVRPKVHKNGGSVDLLATTEDKVRIAIQSSGNGCHSSPDAIRQLVEEAILEVAPETVEIVAEGVPTSASAFVPVGMIQPATREGKNYEESTA
jgi:Fe-S cluster biogenesis protein NfuA